MTDRAPLSTGARVVLAGSFVNALGTGLVLPFLLIYLHDVRHLPLAQTGLLLALPGLTGFVAGPIGGTLADRVGPKRVLVGATLFAGAGSLLVTAVHGAALAVPALVLFGAGNTVFFSAQNGLFSRVAEGAALQRLYASNFVLLNAGIGVGGLVSGAVVDVHRPATFVAIYLVDAATFGLYAVAVGFVRQQGAAPAKAAEGSYREVVRHPLFRWIVGLSVLMALTGYAQIDSGLPAMATVTLGLPPRAVAVALVINTAVIVAGQFLVLRRVERMRRTRAIVRTAAIWSVAWLVLGATATVGPHPARWVMVCVFAGIFGLGETFMAPTTAPLTGAVAPEHLRGRFFASTALTYSVAFTVGPPISTALIAHHLAGVWIGLLVGGCVAFALLARRLAPRLSAAEDNAVVDPEVLVSAGA